MSLAVVPALNHSYAEALRATIRPEFQVDVYTPPVGHPILCPTGCAVPKCELILRKKGLCGSHYERWATHGRPDLADWVAIAPLVRYADPAEFRHTGLAGVRLLESQYLLQVLHDERKRMYLPAHHAPWVRFIAGTGSLLDTPREARLKQAQEGKDVRLLISLTNFAYDRLQLFGDEAAGVSEWSLDVWRTKRIAPGAHTHMGAFDFRRIEPAWLRTLVKQWARSRLTMGKALSTVHGEVRAMIRAVEVFQDEDIALSTPGKLNRGAIEDYLAAVSSLDISAHYRIRLVSALARLLDDNAARGWQPRIPATARLHRGEMPKAGVGLPRFIPEPTMVQLEQRVSLMADEQDRAFLRLLMETGLRSTDALTLAVDGVFTGADHKPYLRFINRKFDREAVIPISSDLANALRELTARNLARWPGTRWMFPRATANADGEHRTGYGTWKQKLAAWLSLADVKDENGKPARPSSHQFRHTVGTRMVNQGVPLEVVRRFLDHSSLEMTGHYAKILDSTLRREWEKSRVPLAEALVTARGALDAEWQLENINRAKQALPNGFCALPSQKRCPHANACLTCPDFRTTKTFLPLHRDQLFRTVSLIEKAEEAGQQRVVEMNEPVRENLQRIITTLEREGTASGT